MPIAQGRSHLICTLVSGSSPPVSRSAASAYRTASRVCTPGVWLDMQPCQKRRTASHWPSRAETIINIHLQLLKKPRKIQICKNRHAFSP
jgi:hypothetical protein